MPTFLHRRYMRAKPKLTERVVGVFVLVLLVFIVGSFLLTGGLFQEVVNTSPKLKELKDAFGISEKPLFVADVGNMKSPAPSHEQRMAEMLLPVSVTTDNAPWSAVPCSLSLTTAADAAEFARDHGLPAELCESAQAFASTMLYHGDYRAGKSPVVSAVVVDAHDPPGAFGLFHARMPAEHKQVNLGRAGWSDATGRRIGFWAGKYYTEIFKPGEQSESTDLMPIAKEIVGRQLLYGGPFWAETVLPTDQRVADSFRYVRRAALGLAELADCWLTDYQGGTTIGVVKTTSPDKVLKALETQLKEGAESTASPAEEGYGDGSHQPAHGEESTHVPAIAATPDAANMPAGAVVGQHEGRPFVAFAAGEYLFIVTSRDSAAVEPIAEQLATRWSPQAGGAVGAGATNGANEGPATAGKARFPEIPGGTILAPTKIERYAENLYEKIDGKESSFRAYFVVDLKFAQYTVPAQQQVYDVYIYDMTEPVNALGMYMFERSDTAQPIDIGRDGYTSGSSVFFWKGQYYINVLGPAEGDTDSLDNAKQIAAAVAETIADAGAPFWADALLPTDDRVPRSLSYQATNALGYEFLQRMFLAKYAVGGKTFQTFVIRAAKAEAAKGLYDQFAEATARYDKIVAKEADDAGAMFVSESVVPGSASIFSVAFHKGPYFAGITECEDRSLAETRAKMFRDRLSATDPGDVVPAAATPAKTSGSAEPASEESGGESESASSEEGQSEY